jgi:hypothetical protein
MAKQALDQIRQAAENDLEFFIQLVAPQQLLGDCHNRVVDKRGR